MPFMNVHKAAKNGGTNNKGKKLTPKMVEFVELYMLHMNATKAAELSTYITDNPNRLGHRLMSHPLIIAEIKKRMDARSEKFEVTAEYLVRKLTNIVDRTEEANPAAAIRAIELLGKTIAVWRDRQEISGPDGEAIKHEQTVKENAAEFTSRISGLAKRAGTSNVVELPVGGRTGKA